MPRNRMIKSEFWTSEQVISCSPMARLLFIGLWNFSDDNGVHPASYVKIKAEVFPADNIDTEEIKKWIGELLQQGLLREFIADEKSYWIVTGWRSHQKIDKPTYRYPLPQSGLKIIPTLMSQVLTECPATATRPISDNSMNFSQEFTEQSASTSRELVEASTKGSDEKKEKEKINKKHLCEVETSPVDVFKSHSNAITLIFEHWQQTLNHPHAKLDKKRKRVIGQALKLGYSETELRKAIDGCKNTPYNMGKNENGQVYDDISLILRDAEHIERFMNNASSNGVQATVMTRNDLMAGVI